MNSPAAGSLALCLVHIFTNDPEASLRFYRDAIGLSVHTDVSDGDFRWVTLTTPNQPDIEILLHSYHGTGMPITSDDATSMHDLLTKGLLSTVSFRVDDFDALFEHVRATGAEVISEPTDQFYGVRDCSFRDPVGNVVRFTSPLSEDRVPAPPKHLQS